MSPAEAVEGGSLSAEGRIRIFGVPSNEVIEEARQSFRHAWPLVLGYVGHNLIGVVDTVLVGRLGATELAGVAIGNGIYFTASVAGMGLVSGLDPILSQAVGAGEGKRIDAAFRAGLKLAVGVALPIVAALMVVTSLLPLMGVSAEITAVSHEFMWARAPGALPFIVMMAFRTLLQSRGNTKAMMWGAITANVVNLLLNALLIYGDGALTTVGLPAVGLPALGVLGSGIASTIATVAQLLVLVRAFRRLEPLEGDGDTNVRVRKIAALGFPISLTYLAEVGAFTVAGIFAGRIGAEAGSGHQIAIQLASLTFTVCMGIANATSVRVGKAVGKQDMRAMQLAGWTGFGLSVLYMTVTSIICLLFAEPLAGLVSNSASVVMVAVPLIHIAAAFQLFDGIQVVGAGALRGLGDTKSVQYANLLGYYVIGLPVAALLAFGLDLGVRGLWWGLCAGLGAVATMVLLRWRDLSRKPIART